MVDPVEFGELKGQFAALQTQVNGIAADVKTLLEMANQGKGGLWMFRSLYLAAGGFLAWAAPHIFERMTGHK